MHPISVSLEWHVKQNRSTSTLGPEVKWPVPSKKDILGIECGGIKLIGLVTLLVM